MTALSEWDSKRLLGEALPTPRETLTRSVDEAVAFARDLGARVVLKASGVPHKTERGLVRVGLDPEAVEAAWQQLAAGGDGTVLAAEEIRGDFELMAGGLRDPQFGPLVSIGLGGTLTEVLADVAFMLAPPEPGELEAAVRCLRSAALFSGHRGRPPPDGEALERLVGAISDLLVSRPDVLEVDCNPIVIRDGAVSVVDALVVRS